MKIAVKDANILIDLVNGDLLGTCLKLPYAFCTTEGVISQLEWEEQWSTVRPFVDAGALEIIELTTQEMEDIFASPLLMKLDVVDLGVMHLAKRENAILLTGDLALRKESAQWGIRVHGLLWLLDQLLESNLLSQRSAAKRLRLIQAQNAYLPQMGV